MALYIRAYYNEPDLFLPWVKDHQANLTLRQVVSIVNQGFGKSMKKDVKKSLIDVIGEIYARQQPAGGAFELKL